MKFLINMSVWEPIEALFEFVYRSAHTGFMVRRREWFERPNEAYQVLWWVPAGYALLVARRIGAGATSISSTASAKAGSLSLAARYAFTFKEHFPPPYDIGIPPSDMKPEPYCVGSA